MRFLKSYYLMILVFLLLQTSFAAYADWIDFQDTEVTESEGGGAASITLVRTGPTADPAFSYLSPLDVSTESGDYDIDPASIDRDFNSPSFALPSGNSPGTILWIREYADGRLLIGGHWDDVDGVVTPSIIRLLPDGTIDSTFLVNLANNARIPLDGYVLADDKAYVTVAFTDSQGDNQIFLVRLNEDGSVDQSFSQVVADRSILTFDVQSNGNIVVGGTFSRVNNQVRAGVARILPNGTLDTNFDTGFPESWGNSAGGYIFVVKVQPDGKVIVGGELDTWGAVDVDALVRLDVDGALDPTFAPPSSPLRNQILDIELLSSGRIIVPHSNAISMFEANGDLVAGFAVSLVGAVKDISLQDDGQILVAGSFVEVNGQATESIARLNPNGSLDPTFTTGFNVEDHRNGGEAVVERHDGSILLGGSWTTINGQNESILLQLNGSLKANWDANQGGNQSINIPLVDDLVYEGDEQLQLQIATVGEGTVEIGAAATATVTIADNDPFLDQPIGSRTATEGQPFSLDVSSNFVHSESALLTFSATGLPNSLSINATGAITGTPITSDSLSSPYSVEVTAIDPAGATASGVFNLSVIDAPAPPTQQSSGGGSIDIVWLSIVLLVALRRRLLIHTKNKSASNALLKSPNSRLRGIGNCQMAFKLLQLNGRSLHITSRTRREIFIRPSPTSGQRMIVTFPFSSIGQLG